MTSKHEFGISILPEDFILRIEVMKKYHQAAYRSPTSPHNTTHHRVLTSIWAENPIMSQWFLGNVTPCLNVSRL